ncbi:MAG: TIGR02679 family protein, partial [Iamia sp.]
PLVGAEGPAEDDGWAPRSEAEAEAVRALDWRRTWATVGVLCDDLSVSALALNLPVAHSSELVADTIAGHAIVGEPLRLTLRQLATAEIEVVPASVVHVCENPAVVGQAASLLGDECAPLVCVEGNPDSAVAALLDLLVDGGAVLRYHGDFDWGGLTIANQVMARWGAAPWRMGEADYRAAAGAARKPLTGRSVAASWDPGLAPAMIEAGLAVHEEQVISVLLGDLAEGT